MKLIYKHEDLLVDSRFLWASVSIFVITGILLLRLWYLQIYKGEYYQKISEKNRVRRIEIPAPRGVIYDRHGEVALGNRPYFDLVFIPQYVKDREATFKILSRLLHIPVSRFEKRLRATRGRPKFLPIHLKRNLSLHEVSTIESNKIFLPGIEVLVAPRRQYKPLTPPHMVGYLREVDPVTLQEHNKNHPDNPYLPGDLIGKQGLEYRWESYLRGKRGYRLIQVDAFGRQTHAFEKDGWEFPEVPAIPGADLELTIDLELQKIAKEAFNGKYGAVMAVNPQNGEILAAVSEPGFDPALMQQGLSNEDWQALTNNPFKPFLDKTTGGEFAPGSIYKPVVAMAALEEKVINLRTTFRCPGYFVLGNQILHCHNRTGHGLTNLKLAMMKSCDVFFYHVGVELGVERLAIYGRSLGLGQKLGGQLNAERPGLIPTSAWKQMTLRYPWIAGDTPNISIGQGYLLMTPIQMVNLYATIANGGTVWQPYLIKRITDHIGELVIQHKPKKIKEVDLISKQTFATMRRILREVVMNQEGTGKRAKVEGHTVAGKTGSVQVVSLKKNRNQTDVSMRWKEHALFAAFSPVENAEISVIIVSQNDKQGGGGVAAAPVAKKIIEAYWKLKQRRIQISKQKEKSDHG